MHTKAQTPPQHKS